MTGSIVIAGESPAGAGLATGGTGHSRWTHTPGLPSAGVQTAPARSTLQSHTQVTLGSSEGWDTPAGDLHAGAGGDAGGVILTFVPALLLTELVKKIRFRVV